MDCVAAAQSVLLVTAGCKWVVWLLLSLTCTALFLYNISQVILLYRQNLVSYFSFSTRESFMVVQFSNHIHSDIDT